MSEGNGLPMGWISVPLKEVVIPGGTQNPRSNGNGTFRYVDIEALDNTRQQITAAKTLENQKAPSRARMKILAGDILFSLVRPYLKNIAIVPPELDNQIASTAFCVLRPAHEIESAFLFYQVVREEFIHSIPTYGNSPPAARDDEFLMATVRIAPRPEQRRLVEKIEELFTKLDAGVSALLRVRAELKRYRAAVLKAAVEGKLTADWRTQHPAKETGAELLRRILVERRRKWEQEQQAEYKAPTERESRELPKLPPRWIWVSCDALLTKLASGSAAVPHDEPTDKPILRSSSVRSRIVNLNDARYLADGSSKSDEPVLGEGDLLFVRLSGSLEFVGACGVVRGLAGRRIVFPDRLFRGRTVLPTLGPFIELCFASPPLRQMIAASVKSTAGHKRISMGAIKEQPIPLPPIEEQEAILTEVDRRLSIVDEVETEIETDLKRASRLRQSLLKRAFEGRLVPQDPNDEPAEKLLDKIRVARNDKSNR